MASTQPAGRWWAPSTSVQLKPNIHIHNSLSRKKDAFKPIKAGEVSWYACGPTVYDDAHLGHARNYVTTDIVRRILRDYFALKVKFVMNITDVDDKIILRGRQQYLLSKYRKETANDAETTRRLAQAALQKYLQEHLPLIQDTTKPQDVKQAVSKAYSWIQVGPGRPADIVQGSDQEAKLKMHIRTVERASQAMIVAPAKWDEAVFYEGVEDILLPYLDSLHGSKIDATDHSIFTTLTQRYEERFMQDMRELNVLDPDVVTRVTGYSQQIVDFVKKIEDNGFAYKTADGSVYFDISAFEKDKKNTYAKLKPENRGDKALQADGEGALSKETSEKRSEKRSDADFALWKASKPGEPAWQSPWGQGRPGWHIECSAMASDVFGGQMDIHSGGIDLAFPHHDNELAQSEAYLRDHEHDHEHNWVNYFIHIGHLSIQGAKMSKSLKNFTTIRQALARREWTSRSLRIVFLMGGWKEGIEITNDMVKAGSSWEERVNNFFLNALDLIEVHRKHNSQSSASDADGILEKALEQAITKTEQALSDSFNTPEALNEMSKLVGAFNNADKTTLGAPITERAARWVTAMVNMFGLNGLKAISDPTIGWSGVTIPEEARDYIYPLAEYRDELRRKARGPDGLTSEDVQPPSSFSSALSAVPRRNNYSRILSNFENDVHSAVTKSSSPQDLSKQVLSICDELRNTKLWSHDIYLEDRDALSLPALVRPVTAELKAQRAEKEAREQSKLEAKAKKEREDGERLEKGKLSEKDMFKAAEFMEWDEDGMPTKDAEGKEVAKSRLKKLRKDWERQKVLHEKWQASSDA